MKLTAVADQLMTPVPMGSSIVGQTLRGTYRVLGVLDQGGMGTVYLGEQINLRRRVAIKVLAQHLAAQEHALRRFRREAEIIAQLQHPHVVNVFDFDMTKDGEPYLVMEFLEGESLDQRLQREFHLELPDVVRIISQAASGLHAAHRKQIVHRDLKPGNVYLAKTSDGYLVKVLDFGISKSRDLLPMGITAEYAVLGTPEYMAPEQAAGQTANVDHLGDQFSLAVIAYEMMTGVTPFFADTVEDILENVMHSEPLPVSRRAPGVPAELDAVLDRALRKLPASRYPSIQEFANAFVAASGLAHVASPATPLPPASAPRQGGGPVSQPTPVTSPHFTSPPITSPPITSPPITSPPITSSPVTLPPVSETPVRFPRPGADVLSRLVPATSPPVSEPPASVKHRDPGTDPPASKPSFVDSGVHSRHSLPPNPSSRARIQTSPIRQFLRAVSEARLAFNLGDVDLAVRYAESGLRVAESCPSAEMDGVVEQASPLFDRIFRARLGSKQRKVRVQPEANSSDKSRAARRSEPSPAQIVLLQHLKEGAAWEENLHVAPLSERESLRALVALVVRGTVTLD